MQITKQEMEVLKVLRKVKHATPITIKGVYEKDGDKISNVWRELTDLEQEGLVKRINEKEYALTEKAEELFEEKKEVQTRPKTMAFSKEEQDAFYKFAENGNVLNNLSSIFASHILGSDNVKKGVMLALISDKDRYNSNNRISVLIEGKPGTGKTQIMKYANDNTWGIFADAKTLSGVGLAGTGNGAIVTEGLLQKSDGSVLYIDELDKFKPEDQAYLLSAMSNGKISINKDQVKDTSKAEVRIIATTNHTDKIIPELKDRFDLMYYTELPSEDERVKIIRNKINNWDRPGMGITEDFFRKYISYANSEIETKLPEDREWMTSHIVQLIKGGSLKGESTRKMESIFRISKAIAKLKLKSVVESDDLKEAIELIGTQKEGKE